MILDMIIINITANLFSMYPHIAFEAVLSCTPGHQLMSYGVKTFFLIYINVIDTNAVIRINRVL